MKEYKDERVLAYDLAAPVSQETFEDVSGGGIDIVPPTIRLTGEPLSPDASFDSGH